MNADIKEIARRTWEEIFPACDVEALRAVVDDDVTDRGARPGEAPGFEGVKQTMLWLGRVFADQRWEIHTVVGEGDTVVVHCTHHGRQVGDLMGIPPTNREVAYQYVHFLRFRGGRAIEHWSVRDDMTLMRQLGVLPAREPAAAAAG
jgi:predicted ester cyclase